MSAPSYGLGSHRRIGSVTLHVPADIFPDMAASHQTGCEQEQRFDELYRTYFARVLATRGRYLCCVADPFVELLAEDNCWCESGRAYGDCHGGPPASAPGDPLPPDSPDALFLSPHTRISREALGEMAQAVRDEPMHMPSPNPVQRPQRVSELAAEMTSIGKREPTVALREIGRLRFEILAGLGLSDANKLDQRLTELAQDDLDQLAYSTLDLAKATTDRLLEQAKEELRPTVVWSERDEIEAVVGRTLLWADHYLVPDPLFDALVRRRLRREDLTDPLRELVRLRPLIEAGVVVPVPVDLAVAITNSSVVTATDADLGRRDLVRWIDQQLVVEGPTAREALFLNARDDIEEELGFFFLHAHILPDTVDDETRTFMSRLLAPYDPDYDYAPWVAQSRRQTVAAIIQRANRDIAIAESFGGRYLTRSPFRARLQHRRGDTAEPSTATLWVDVPYLPDSDARGLARVLRDEAAVEALRHEVRRAFRTVTGDDPAEAREAAQGLVEDLARAAERLEAQMRTERAWGLAAPAAGGAISIAIGATTGPIGALAALAAAGLGLGPYAATRTSRKQNAAYVFLLAKQATRRGREARPTETFLKPAQSVTAQLHE